MYDIAVARQFDSPSDSAPQLTGGGYCAYKVLAVIFCQALGINENLSSVAGAFDEDKSFGRGEGNCRQEKENKGDN
jgi:hypothetical protein